MQRTLPQQYTKAYSAPFKADVWLSQGPARISERLAASLNQLMLDDATNPNGTALVYGQEGAAVTYVEVRWIWLLLPYTLTVAGVIFLLMVMYGTYRAGAPVWKSSVHALLYHGLQREGAGDSEEDKRSAESARPHDAHTTALSTVREMHQHAARMRVRLMPSEDTGRLFLATSEANSK